MKRQGGLEWVVKKDNSYKGNGPESGLGGKSNARSSDKDATEASSAQGDLRSILGLPGGGSAGSTRGFIPKVEELFQSVDKAETARKTEASGKYKGNGTSRYAGASSSASRAGNRSRNVWHDDWEDTWGWDDYIILRDSTIRVELSDCGLSDADLPSLMEYLDAYLQRHYEGYKLNVDLSINWAVSDMGVKKHLAPFLNRWPACTRLKLYRTSIGDGALEALGPWVASGNAHELHFSDLGGQVTSHGVLSLLRNVARGGKYPYQNIEMKPCALWLRLEHNGISDTAALLRKAEAEGVSLCALEKQHLDKVRPCGPNTRRECKEVPAVHLVLFHMQEIRVKRLRAPDVGSEAQAVVEENTTEEVHAREQSNGDAPTSWLLNQEEPEGEAAMTARPHWAKELMGAFKIVEGCQPDNDTQMLAEWHRHLESATNPEEEAGRIWRMMVQLSEQGYARGPGGKIAQTLPDGRRTRSGMVPSPTCGPRPSRPGQSAHQAVSQPEAEAAGQEFCVDGLGDTSAYQNGDPEKTKKGKNKISRAH